MIMCERVWVRVWVVLGRCRVQTGDERAWEEPCSWLLAVHIEHGLHAHLQCMCSARVVHVCCLQTQAMLSD